MPDIFKASGIFLLGKEFCKEPLMPRWWGRDSNPQHAAWCILRNILCQERDVFLRRLLCQLELPHQ